MPLIILFIIGAILLPIITAKNANKPAPPAQPHVNEPGRVPLEELRRRQQTGAPAGTQQPQQRPQTTVVRPQSVYQYVRDAVEQAAAEDANSRARQEELKRRLEENARRRAQETASGMQRQPLQRQGKPIVAHADDDCGGGSIHDGYHEGVSTPPVKNPARPVAVAGKLGQRLADEDDALLRQKASADNARRAMARIQKLPPMAQGIIYSEMLGRPKSELG